jgi:hypothetical protein
VYLCLREEGGPGQEDDFYIITVYPLHDHNLNSNTLSLSLPVEDYCKKTKDEAYLQVCCYYSLGGETS